jgi:hypothetical protein
MSLSHAETPPLAHRAKAKQPPRLSRRGAERGDWMPLPYLLDRCFLTLCVPFYRFPFALPLTVKEMR